MSLTSWACALVPLPYNFIQYNNELKAFIFFCCHNIHVKVVLTHFFRWLIRVRAQSFLIFFLLLANHPTLLNGEIAVGRFVDVSDMLQVTCES